MLYLALLRFTMQAEKNRKQKSGNNGVYIKGGGRETAKKAGRTGQAGNNF